MLEVTIRQENSADFEAAHHLFFKAFKRNNEAELVDNLRKIESFIPELSLVAEKDNEIIGQIIFSKITIMDGENIKHNSLALAIMAVLPELQKQGVGKQLIKVGLEKASELGHKSVIVLGHAEYYPKFGFIPASDWDIRAPFDVPDENFLALELVKDGLSPVAGMVIYPELFYTV